jgi:signal transduction histidine kinase/CheY-like chemotaxis protein
MHTKSLLKFLTKTVWLTLAVYCLAYFSINYTRELGRVAALWPANAIVVAALVNEHRWKRIVTILVGAFLANVLARFSITSEYAILSEISFVNCLECLICVGTIRAFVPKKFQVTDPKHLVWYGVSTCFVAPIISGLLAAILISHAGHGKFDDSWLIWYISHGLGLSIFTCLFLVVRPKEVMELISRENLFKTVLVFLGVIAVLALVFWQTSYPILFLPIAALAVAAFHLDIAGAGLCILLTTIVAIVATTNDHGPLALVNGSLTQRVFIMQLFIAVAGLMTLPLAIIVSQRQKLQRSLIRAREQADNANKAKSDFLTSMSHELRTPMNSILGFAQMLELDDKNHLDTKEKQYVGYIISGGNYLLKLINDVLDLARIEAGRFEMKIRSIICRDIVTSLMATLQPLADKRGITLETEFNESVPALEADPDRIMQVLINLGSNAIKYNNEGGTVKISVMPRDSMVRIAISDNGPGIAAEQQKQLFQPFNRLGAEKGKVEGTGIGLTIAKRLVEAMNGAIDFSSDAHGTSFWVDLPNATSLFKTEAHFETIDKLVRKDITAGILYVEDSEANSFLMAQMLRDFLGVEVEIATTVSDGIALAYHNKFDLVLSDIHLPDGTGFDLLKALRDNPHTANLPVIAVTADATEDTRELIKEAGFDAYYTKPFQVAHVVGSIRKLLGK